MSKEKETPLDVAVAMLICQRAKTKAWRIRQESYARARESLKRARIQADKIYQDSVAAAEAELRKKASVYEH